MNTLYTCPMHPEVRMSHPGKCPKCGMGLTTGDESHHQQEKNSYLPLIVVIALISLTTLTLTVRDLSVGGFDPSSTLTYFMVGFFLVFSGFKLLDLKGFAEGYATYDLLAKRWYTYGYIYPFIELFFGLAMILTEARWLLVLEVVIMTFSGLGVAVKLLKKEKFQCACLGTFLKVPLTKVTLVEDFGMALLALILLLMQST